MRLRFFGATGLGVFAAAIVFVGVATGQPHGMGWGPGMMGPGRPGMMGSGGGSMQRHHIAMMGGIPAPYSGYHDPLPATGATINRGAAVYEQNCAACHGATGRGDGPLAANLSQRPANLAWLSQMPMSRWDGYMYWTVAEGGAQFGAAMPAFKSTLTRDQIWSVISYVQAELPRRAGAR